MKKILKIFAVLFAGILLLAYSGCDEIDNLPVNIPVTMEFSTTGGDLTATASFCLDSSDVYQDFVDNLNSIQLLRITYRTTAVTPEGLQGDVNIVIRRQDTGAVLLDATIQNVAPADYIAPNQPFEIVLTQQELELFNSYLAQLYGLCFDATITVGNVTAGDPPFELSGAVDFLFEAETSF